MKWRLPLMALLLTPCLFAQPAAENPWADDEAVLRQQRLPSKGAGLLAILRDRIPTPEVHEQFKKHVAGLHATAFVDRAKATAELKKMGPVVRPLVGALLRGSKIDAETAGRLRLVRDAFPPEKDSAAVTAVARLIQRDKPAGSLTLLLDYVPYVSDEFVRQEVQRAIDAVALEGNKPAPLLLAAVNAANPGRRAAAAEALVRSAKEPVREIIAPLLRDRDPLVRYQLGLALVERRDKAGLPLLIDTLTDSSAERVEKALDLLYQAAGPTAPQEAFHGKDNAAAFQAAWSKWHQRHQAKLDLAHVMVKTEHHSTVIACYHVGVNKGKHTVYELAADHRTVRWGFNGPLYAIDVQILGSNRLLLAEYRDRRVTERDFKGNILWQVPVHLPIACQRLPNGQTFIATRQQLLIVDRAGQAVFTWQPQVPSITAAQRLRNGQIVVVSGNRCQLLNAKGEAIKSFAMNAIYTLGGNIEVLPNGHVLAPLYSNNCVVEYDWNGDKVWQANLKRPTAVARRANGNILVACKLERRIVEINRATGREIWSCHMDGPPFRARPR